MTFDAGSIESASEWAAEISQSAPPQIETVCVLGVNEPPAPGATPTPSLLVAMFAYADSESQAREWLEPIGSARSHGKIRAQADFMTESFKSLQATNDESFPDGHRFAADHAWSNSTPREIFSAVRDVAIAAPSPRSFVFISPNLIRTDLKKTAAEASFSMAGSNNFGAYGFWTDPQQDRANLGWLRSTMAAVDPLAIGRYVGEADLSVTPGRASECFSPAAWQKLTALKKKYDPSDVFFSYLNHA